VEVVIVDGANVVGSRPDGWWRDRAGAARRLHDRVTAAALPFDEIVLVLEGAARTGVPVGGTGPVRVVHAAGSGDDEIVEEARRHRDIDGGREVIVVTADRELRDRVVEAGAEARGPGWLLDQL
jgi:hypothetical protein